MQATQFATIDLGNILSIATVVTGIIALRVDFNKRSDRERKERDTWLEQQSAMHTENKLRLESLMNFQTSQVEINEKRDIQIGELRQQTATIAEIARGMDRRLQMLEDRLT